MLGPYADLFSPEEIVGSPNTKGLNPADVVNQVYFNGYSAKTLYRKLQADKVVSDVQMMKGSEAYYNMFTQKMSVGKELASEPLSRVMTIAHELEHVTQYPYKTGLIRQFANILEQKLKKLDRPNGVTSRLQAEFEAMSAQWDIIQPVPMDVRKKAIESIRANKKLSAQAKSSAIADIEKASLSREEYLKSVAGLHGYTSYNSLRTKNTLIVSAFLVQMSVVGAEEIKTQWQSRN